LDGSNRDAVLRKINKTSVRIASVMTEMRSEYLSNTSLEHYRYASLVGIRKLTAKFVCRFSCNTVQFSNMTTNAAGICTSEHDLRKKIACSLPASSP
jgi:hypothetical protein